MVGPAQVWPIIAAAVRQSSRMGTVDRRFAARVERDMTVAGPGQAAADDDPQDRPVDPVRNRVLGVDQMPGPQGEADRVVEPRGSVEVSTS